MLFLLQEEENGGRELCPGVKEEISGEGGGGGGERSVSVSLDIYVFAVVEQKGVWVISGADEFLLGMR